MKREMFEELLDSVREAGAILRGQKKPARHIVIGASGVRTIRERTKLSQSEFARLIGVSVKTLQNWGFGGLGIGGCRLNSGDFIDQLLEPLPADRFRDVVVHSGGKAAVTVAG